jgi:hypothetical protein
MKWYKRFKARVNNKFSIPASIAWETIRGIVLILLLFGMFFPVATMIPPLRVRDVNNLLGIPAVQRVLEDMQINPLARAIPLLNPNAWISRSQMRAYSAIFSTAISGDVALAMALHWHEVMGDPEWDLTDHEALNSNYQKHLGNLGLLFARTPGVEGVYDFIQRTLILHGDNLAPAMETALEEYKAYVNRAVWMFGLWMIGQRVLVLLIWGLIPSAKPLRKIIKRGTSWWQE